MHAQVIGTTCAGKSESAILPWAIQDIKNGSGCLIIDGKSDASFLTKLYSYVKDAGREQDFRLFSLANPGPSSSFNPLKGNSAQEVTERVFSSFTFENEYYKNVQYKLFLRIVRLIFAQNEIPTFSLVQLLLTNSDELEKWVEASPDELLKRDMVRFLKLSEREREERTSGLETMLSHFTSSEMGNLFEETAHSINFDEALEQGQIIYFQLPTMYFPFLAAATGKLVLQCFQNAVSKRQIYLDGVNDREKPKFFSCILDDFQDYIYEGFGSLLNKSRSANVGVVFSHQALGDLDKVSEAFRNVVLTNTNIKVVMRMNDPETCDHFAKTFGTQTSTKVTEKTKDGDSTGDGTIREVEQFNFHPNIFKKLGTGYGIVSIPHRDGVKNIHVKFAMRKNLPPVALPMIAKRTRVVSFAQDMPSQKDQQTEIEMPTAPA